MFSEGLKIAFIIAAMSAAISNETAFLIFFCTGIISLSIDQLKDQISEQTNDTGK